MKACTRQDFFDVLVIKNGQVVPGGTVNGKRVADDTPVYGSFDPWAYLQEQRSCVLTPHGLDFDHTPANLMAIETLVILAGVLAFFLRRMVRSEDTNNEGAHHAEVA